MNWIICIFGFIFISVGLWGLFGRDHGFVPTIDKYDGYSLITLIVGVVLWIVGGTFL